MHPSPTFTQLGLLDTLLRNLALAGHEIPTPIQARAIPLAIEGRDLLGIAQTGTGKSAAFTLPILQRLLTSPLKVKGGAPRALVLSPTRELAQQIQESFSLYGKELGLVSAAIYGGVGQSEQVRTLRSGVDVLVATPGRLLDLIEQRLLRLSSVEVFVMDEADRMLDMGFIEDIQRIHEFLPMKKQTMMFSATMPGPVAHLAKSILVDPEKIEVARSGTSADNIAQKIVLCSKKDKFQLLKKILKEEESELTIVFTKTKDTADKVRAYLIHHRIPCLAIHGDKDQAERERALTHFKSGDFKVLIATDIAARGLDVQGVSHVINFELPNEAESYVHRIGRTARAGKAGVAITFCDDAEKGILERVQKLIKQNLPLESFKGKAEPSGVWSSEGPMQKKTKAPTPGKSQEKTAYLDHSKRQRLTPDGKSSSKQHPGLRAKKKKR